MVINVQSGMQVADPIFPIPNIADNIETIHDENIMARFQILTFDGGGIRGAFGTTLMETFEEKLGRPITDFFDLVAGTSTGAILGAGVAHGMSGKQLVDFYTHYGEEIFSPRESYKPKSWVKTVYPLVKYVFNKRTDGGEIDDFFRARFCPIALKHSFDEGFGDAKLGDLRKSRLLVSTVNLSKGKTCFSHSTPADGGR